MRGHLPAPRFTSWLLLSMLSNTTEANCPHSVPPLHPSSPLLAGTGSSLIYESDPKGMFTLQLEVSFQLPVNKLLAHCLGLAPVR